MNDNKIVIEKLTKLSSKDAEALRHLTMLIGPRSQSLTDNDIREIYTSSHISLIVARTLSTRQIIGMVTLAIYRIPYTKKAYLDDIVVDEKHRGQGIGSRLLDTAIHLAKEQRAAFIEFTSHPRRIASNKLYEKFGFTKRETNIYRLTYEKKSH